MTPTTDPTTHATPRPCRWKHTHGGMIQHAQGDWLAYTAEIVRAVNTFDQARKALRALVQAVELHEVGSIVGLDRVKSARTVLAAMEEEARRYDTLNGATEGPEDC